MKFVLRYVAFVAIIGVVAACSALQPGNTPRLDSVSASPADSAGLPTQSNAASTEPSIRPTSPNESATPNSASGYVDPDLAAQLAAKCQVAGAIGYYFAIPVGSTLQTVFPSGKTPELDGVEGLFVAVYDGDVRILNYTGGGPPVPGSTPQLTFQNVVCVVPPAGEVEVYSDVSHEGMALPPGAHVGPPPTSAP